ncbi:MAG: ATPase, T2SS/T4P/T4SS family [Thermogutta sp.]
MLPPIERHNIRQLEELNQRGGRMLTVVDLIEAGTISPEMAAAVMEALARGASILTGARPSGAGKTTVLAAFLNLLPPDVTIVTVDDPGVVGQALARPPEHPTCYLVHEIGAGHWYGYLWGQAVSDYLRLTRGPHRIASCLHADTLEELTHILTSPPLCVDPSDLHRVGILGFMRMDASARGSIVRRLATLHIRVPFVDRSCRFVFSRSSNSFSREPLSDAGYQSLGGGSPTMATSRERTLKKAFLAFIEHLLGTGARSLEEVREEVLAFYKQQRE